METFLAHSQPPPSPNRLFHRRSLQPLRLVFSFLIVGCSALGQGIVTGTVTNSATGAPLEGARVQLKGTDREVSTDNAGMYRINNLPLGNAVVTITYTGLTTVEIPVVVGDGVTTQNVGLT